METDLLIVLILGVRLTIVQNYKLINDIVPTYTLESKSFFNLNFFRSPLLQLFIIE